MKKLVQCILPMLCVFHYAYSQKWNKEQIPGNLSVTSLTFDGPKIFATVIPTNNTGGVFRKTNPALATWDNANTNLNLSTNNVPYAFAMTTTNNITTLFVGTGVINPTASTPSIQKSGDPASGTQNLNWINNCTPGGVAFPGMFKALLVNKNMLYAGTYGTKKGIFTTTNNGQTWRDDSSRICNNINAFISLGNDVYAATDLGIIKRSNNIGAWHFFALKNIRVLSLAITADGKNILAGTDGSGIYHGTFNGSTWTFSAFNSGLPNNATVNTILIDGATAYAGITSASVSGGPVLFSFTNTTSGFVINVQNHWLPFNTGLAMVKKVTCLAKSGNYFYAGTNAGIYRYY